ncbi:MAG: RhoGEF domain-containing protein [Legionellales bacterium]
MQSHVDMKQALPMSNTLIELIFSEDSYRDKLHYLHKELPLMVQQQCLLAKFLKFIDYLIDISDKLLENITASMNMSPDSDDGELIKLTSKRTQILMLFATISHQYQELYRSYIADISNQRIELPNGALLISYLIEPIQRGPRYGMFIDGILKHDGHQISPQTANALTFVKTNFVPVMNNGALLTASAATSLASIADPHPSTPVFSAPTINSSATTEQAATPASLYQMGNDLSSFFYNTVGTFFWVAKSDSSETPALKCPSLMDPPPVDRP